MNGTKENLEWREATRLAPSFYEEQVRRDAIINEENELRSRQAAVRKNRANGHPEPNPGDVIYVTLARGLVRRGRAGLRFGNQPTAVEVVDLSDEDVRLAQANGNTVVNRWGAELILEDDSLIVSARQPASQDFSDLARRNREQEEELKLLREENAKLMAARREARRNAPASNDGRPTRLRAQEAAGPAPAPLPDSDDASFLDSSPPAAPANTQVDKPAK